MNSQNIYSTAYQKTTKHSCISKQSGCIHPQVTVYTYSSHTSFKKAELGPWRTETVCFPPEWRKQSSLTRWNEKLKKYVDFCFVQTDVLILKLFCRYILKLSRESKFCSYFQYFPSFLTDNAVVFFHLSRMRLLYLHYIFFSPALISHILQISATCPTITAFTFILYFPSLHFNVHYSICNNRSLYIKLTPKLLIHIYITFLKVCTSSTVVFFIASRSESNLQLYLLFL